MNKKDNPVKPVMVLITVIGLAMSYLGYTLSANVVKQKHETRFNKLIDSYGSAIEKEISVHTEIMQNLQGLFRASTQVDRDEFAIFASPIVQRHATLQALEWVPLVEAEARIQLETLAVQDGFTDFRFSWRNDHGELATVPEKQDYFPVYYVEPFAGNEAALGYDLSSDSKRRTTLEQSRDSGQILATEPIMLIQAKKQQKGILLFAPVFREDPKTIEERRQQLRGFVVAVLRIEDMIDRATRIESTFKKDIAIELIDTNIPGEPELLYRSSASDHNTHQDWTSKKAIQENGRVWLLKAWPLPGFITSKVMWPSYLILLSGVTLTLLIVFYVYLLMNRERQVRQLVHSRTEELKISDKRTQVILDAALNSIITINIDGIIRSFNPAAERLFGYHKDEVIGQNVKILMPSPYREEHDGYLQRYHATRERHIIGIGREVEGQKKNGSRFPLQLSVSETEINGNSLFVGVIIDLTEQKQNEQLLIDAKENAERMNRAKSEFLNMMSHELRTPLTVIMGYLPILKNKDAMPEPEIIAELAGDMESSGEHLLTLINDLLDISKIEAGKLELKKERLSSATIANDLVSSLSSNAQNRNIELENRVDDFELYADRVRLMQILINLIGNAIKFTSHGKITLSAKDLGDYSEFSVADTGCGMAAEELPSIFEKFHQVDSSSTRKAGGTGLGLAITKKLIELHGGEISVTSTVNKGSTFTFTIKNNKEKS